MPGHSRVKIASLAIAMCGLILLRRRRRRRQLYKGGVVGRPGRLDARCAPGRWMDTYFSRVGDAYALNQFVGHARFRRVFRLPWQFFVYLFGRVQHRLTPCAKANSNALSAMEKFAIAMMRLGVQGFDTMQPEVVHRSEDTVYNALNDVALAIVGELWDEAVRAPTTQEANETVRVFRERGCFTPALMAVDGKHFAILKSKSTGDYYDFQNYKGFSSVTVVAGCDHRYKFTYVSDFHAGKLGDADVAAMAYPDIERMCTSIELDEPLRNPDGSVLMSHPVAISDAGFPLMSYMITRVRDDQMDRVERGENLVPPGRKRGRDGAAAPAPEHIPYASFEIFQRALLSIRNIIECCWGHLVMRFPILNQTLPFKHSRANRATLIVKMCMTMHNLLQEQAKWNAGAIMPSELELLRELDPAEYDRLHDNDHIGERGDANAVDDSDAVTKRNAMVKYHALHYEFVPGTKRKLQQRQ